MTIWPMMPTLAIYHLISWIPLGVLEGKNSQCESFLTDKEMITDE